MTWREKVERRMRSESNGNGEEEEEEEGGGGVKTIEMRRRRRIQQQNVMACQNLYKCETFYFFSVYILLL